MSKFCSKGHQMEESWDTCPTCQTTGYQVPAAPPPAKTRLETDTSKDFPGAGGGAAGSGAGFGAGAGGAAAAGAGRRTVLISEKRKPPIVGWFVAMSGDQKGEDFRLHEGKNTVGSASDSQVTLRDTTVSGQHASVRYEDGKFLLTDLDSSNGTFLNDRKVVREELKDNDEIRFGEVIVKFKRL